jgi:LPS-assembly lipoprotein
MSWSDRHRLIRTLTRASAALAIAALTGGCFQPLYGTHKNDGGEAIATKMSSVDVAKINLPNGTRLSRIGVEVRNQVIFNLTGGGPEQTSTHKLEIHLSSTLSQVIVDVNTARPDIQNYGIDATFSLTDLATGKVVVNGQTFARVSYDIPGQEQRFAGERGLRDAENRAAQVIADNIRSRLASYFVAGS